MPRNVVVAQSGGPSPVINASLQGVIEACRYYPEEIGRVYAGWHGIEGVLKEELLDLGPTFVKLGQIASTRGDLYPPEFTKELESLQDDVPPVEFDTIVNYDIFKEFDPVPFKSASIGQVHMAVLQSGQKVVVKKKRPGILDIVKEDTDNIREIVQFLEYVGIDKGNSSGRVLNESIE